MKISDRAIGFRVKSGYAIAVVLEGSRRSPAAVVAAHRSALRSAKAETRQPYHSRVGEASRIRARSLPA